MKLRDGWWRGKDSNLRRQSRQIYSLIPLTAREPLHTGNPVAPGLALEKCVISKAGLIMRDHFSLCKLFFKNFLKFRQLLYNLLFYKVILLKFFNPSFKLLIYKEKAP